MYPGAEVKVRPDQAAFIMASTGETVTYAELERRSNRLAHYFRDAGLERLDHYSIFMENHGRYIECCGAGERSGLYYTCVNSYLQPDELAYILTNSQSKVLITSTAKLAVALEALKDAPDVERVLVVDGPGDGGEVANLDEALGRLPGDADPRREARRRHALFVRHHRPAEGHHPPAAGHRRRRRPLPLFDFLTQPLALPRGDGLPLAGAALSLRAAGGGRPDHPLRRDGGGHGALRPGAVPGSGRALPRHPQPARADHVLAHAEAAAPKPARRYDLSSLEVVIHAAAPCPHAGQAADDRVVGADHPRVLRRDRGPGLHRLRHRRMAGPPGHGRARWCWANCTSSTRRCNPPPKGEPGTIWFKTARRSNTSTTRRRPRKPARPTGA